MLVNVWIAIILNRNCYKHTSVKALTDGNTDKRVRTDGHGRTVFPSFKRFSRVTPYAPGFPIWIPAEVMIAQPFPWQQTRRLMWGLRCPLLASTTTLRSSLAASVSGLAIAGKLFIALYTHLVTIRCKHGKLSSGCWTIGTRTFLQG